jgi:hypothetical protein
VRQTDSTFWSGSWKPRRDFGVSDIRMLASQDETDSEKIRSKYLDAVQELTVLRRSAIVNQLYGGWKLAVEVPPTKTPDILERADT